MRRMLKMLLRVSMASNWLAGLSMSHGESDLIDMTLTMMDDLLRSSK